MALDLVDNLSGKPPAIARGPVTGRVTRVDSQGVWVVPVGGDLRTPIGPCRGPSDIPVGTVVMVIYTQERPWVFGAELLTPLSAEARDLALVALLEAALAAHAETTTDVHGIPDTSDLETEAGAQDKANAAVAEHETALHGDTGRRLVVAAGGVTDLPDLEVVLRRSGHLVTVWTREAATTATHAGATEVYAIPAGFRPEPPHVAGLVVDHAGAELAGRLVAASSGTLTLTAVAGERHHGALTFTTSDTWPAVLPGTEDT